MNNKTVLSIFIAFIISFGLIMVDFVKNKDSNIYALTNMNSSANLVYRVYLEGKSIGVVKSKEKLEKYIDNEQLEIKKKYNVDKVYAPNDLDIVREYTYNEKTLSEEALYNKIKEIKGSEAFTINGYKIDIEGIDEETDDGVIEVDDSIIYVIDKSVFENATLNMIKAFIDSNSYDNYVNNTQGEIVDVGSLIQNLYIENDISITETKIPTGEKIYTDVDELSQVLIFGKENKKTDYIVKLGDTIEDVSNDNKMSTEEFLIANTNFNSKDDLLYPGQVVTLGILEPQMKIVEERYVVEERDIDYEVTYVDDNTQYVGYEKVQQEGKVGSQIVTEIQKYVNGEFKDRKSISSLEITPAVNKIVVRGTLRKYTTSSWDGVVPVDIGSWVWPTNSGYYITSGYGWRWGKLHNGIDIAGTGYGSPVKAANNGIVVLSSYNDYNGNFMYVAHSNGYFTYYGHMSKRYKNAGDVVYAGDVIGTVGDTGYAFGAHLHFSVSIGYPYRSGSSWVNPLGVIQ